MEELGKVMGGRMAAIEGVVKAIEDLLMQLVKDRNINEKAKTRIEENLLILFY